MIHNMNYADLRRAQTFVEKDYQTTLQHFNNYKQSINFEPGPMGLTPDHIKALPEYRYWRGRLQEVMDKSRRINSELTRRFKTQYRADLRAERDARRNSKQVNQ